MQRSCAIWIPILLLLSAGLAACLEEEPAPGQSSATGAHPAAVAAPAFDPASPAGALSVPASLARSGNSPPAAVPAPSAAAAGTDLVPATGAGASAREIAAALERSADADQLPLLVRLGAVAIRGQGDADEALVALQAAELSVDPDTARVAQGIREDLERLRAWQAREEQRAANSATERRSDPPQEPTAPPALPYLQGGDAVLPLSRLQRDALESPDAATRLDAIARLVGSRSDAAVEILAQASGDPHAANREAALLALGRLAAEGRDDPRIATAFHLAAAEADLDTAAILDAVQDRLATLPEERAAAARALLAGEQSDASP
jgi:hypothetical protein